MEKTKIKKFNTAGKVGYIISIFLIIGAIASMVAVGILGVMAGTILKDDVDVKIHTNININSKGNIIRKLNNFLFVDGVEDLNTLVENSEEVEINDNDISELSIKKSENGGLVIDAKTNEMTISINRIFIALVSLFIFLGAVTVTLHMVKGLMKALKNCETPFSEDVIKRMNNFAISLVCTVVLKILLSGSWSSIVAEGKLGFTIDLGSILLVAVIYVLITVFKYGAELQKESDETL